MNRSQALYRQIRYGQPVNRRHPLNRGLLAWYRALPKLAGGGKYWDLCGRYHGTLTSGPLWSSGMSRQALKLDGTDDYVLITGEFGMPVNLTVSAWGSLVVLDASSSNSDIIAMGAHISLRCNTAGIDGIYQYGASSWRTTSYTGGSLVGAGWHHLAFVIDDTNNAQRIYLDGKNVASSAFTEAILYNGGESNTRLGRNSGTVADYGGWIDDVRFYNRALNDSEVALLYAESRTPHTSLLNYLPRRIRAVAAAGGGKPWLYYAQQHQATT
jgi:hypothetical protein